MFSDVKKLKVPPEQNKILYNVSQRLNDPDHGNELILMSKISGVIH